MEQKSVRYKLLDSIELKHLQIQIIEDHWIGIEL